MAHDGQSTGISQLVQLLSEHGFDGMAEATEILMNEAMKLERAEVLGARPQHSVFRGPARRCDTRSTKRGRKRQQLSGWLA